MLNKFLFTLCAALSLVSYKVYSDSQIGTASIKWQTNYEQAVQESNTTSRPLILFFTGSDWCGWCNKLDEEAFETTAFAEAAGNKFVFVKLDFPLYSPQNPQLKTQNKQLQQKFDVRSFPTVIIVDPKQNQQIGITGYRPGGGQSFADHLIKMVNDYSQYKQKISALDKSVFSNEELKQIYEKAKELGLTTDATKITKKGMHSENSLYFMIERYRYLAEEGQIHNKEAVALRQQLLNADPLNEKQIPYQIAVVDFETYSGDVEKENYTCDLAVTPLVSYIEKFGSKDKDNLWRLQLLISQVYLDKNEMTAALKYAQHSYESAPLCVQPELARAIQNIRSQIHSSR